MKKKQRLSDLFYNNRFLMVFSVVVAIAFWLVVVVEFGVEVEKEIKNVPVTIDYERIENDFGLKPFGEKNYYADVKISGKKYIVDSDDISNEITVKANTGYVSAADNYTIKLSVSTDSELFDIVGITSSDEINIKFDYPGSKEMIIEPEIDFDGESVADGYYLAEYIFPESNTVRVTGPETEVNKVEKVVARASVDGELSENLTVEADLVALNDKGETVSYISFNRQNNKASIILPVYKVAELELTCGITGRPSDYVENLPLIVLVNPTMAEIAVPEKKLEGTQSLEIKTVDFSEIRAGANTFEVKAEDIPNAVVIDGTEKFVVMISADGMDEKTLKTDFEVGFINYSSESNVELVKFDVSEIMFVGPVSSVNAITAENTNLTADLSSIPAGAKGEFSVPVTVASGDCWIYGNPTVTVSIS